MSDTGIALGTAVSTAMAVVVAAGSLPPPVTPEVVEGANSKDVLVLIRVADRGGKATLSKSLQGVMYRQGEQEGQPEIVRPARVTDIPGGIKSVCKTSSIRNKGSFVHAVWDCKIPDVIVARDFEFRGNKLVEIRNSNWAMPL